MSKLSKKLNSWDSFDFPTFLNSRTTEDVKRVLLKSEINEYDLLTLISPSADSLLEEIALKSKAITEREFGKTVQIYTPLYLSSYCKNRCTYCGFNEKNKIPRKKLNRGEIISEGERLKSLDIKHVLLLTGGDRINTPLTYIEEAVTILKPLFDSISIEVYALNEDEYKKLFDLGVDNITIYQETYNRELYSHVHLSGEKANYNFRLEAPERAAKAGARSVNLGALLGLGDPYRDFFMAALHSKLIRDSYPGCDVSLSFPRLRDAKKEINREVTVEDRLLAKMIMAFRLYIPRGGVSISTRESRELRDNLLPLGVTKMSAQSKTSVGSSENEQFKISDERSVEELDRDLKNLGYQPVYKDWVMI